MALRLHRGLPARRHSLPTRQTRVLAAVGTEPTASVIAADLLQWATSDGGIDSGKCSIREFPGKGRGLVATAAIDAEEVILAVPFPKLFTGQVSAQDDLNCRALRCCCHGSQPRQLGLVDGLATWASCSTALS